MSQAEQSKSVRKMLVLGPRGVGKASLVASITQLLSGGVGTEQLTTPGVIESCVLQTNFAAPITEGHQLRFVVPRQRASAHKVRLFVRFRPRWDGTASICWPQLIVVSCALCPDSGCRCLTMTMPCSSLWTSLRTTHNHPYPSRSRSFECCALRGNPWPTFRSWWCSTTAMRLNAPCR